MNKFRWIVAVVIFAVAYDASAIADCSKPKSKTDWLLCSNDRAASEEQRMALAFRSAMYRVPDREQLLREQQAWNETVRDACNDVPCLVQAFRQRAEELETY
ncbi:MAG: hypothetical protein C5B46_05955 [Proteobacteria bacterium]|nr:MAG: hypothetical protein C5B46_05955 [Pseudomonadota bacterium]